MSVIPVHQREEAYLQEFVKQRFSTSLMSDSKWVKLISTLVENHSLIQECLVKPIWDNAEPTRKLVFDENTSFTFDYYATAMEAMVSGKPRSWYAYKEVEWLDFPRVITAKVATPVT